MNAPMRIAKGHFSQFLFLGLYNESMEKCKIECCKKKPCPCGLRAVFIPASLASEMTPKNGAFDNAIVKYEDTGEIWIYDKDGVPMKIKEGDVA